MESRKEKRKDGRKYPLWNKFLLTPMNAVESSECDIIAAGSTEHCSYYAVFLIVSVILPKCHLHQITTNRSHATLRWWLMRLLLLSLGTCSVVVRHCGRRLSTVDSSPVSTSLCLVATVSCCCVHTCVIWHTMHAYSRDQCCG